MRVAHWHNRRVRLKAPCAQATFLPQAARGWPSTARPTRGVSFPAPTRRPRVLTRDLLLVLFLLAAAVCLAGQFGVVREVLAGRAPGVSRRPGARWADIAWVLIPAVALLAVLVATWMRISAPESPLAGFSS